MFLKTVLTFLVVGALSANAMTIPVARSPAPEPGSQELEAWMLKRDRNSGTNPLRPGLPPPPPPDPPVSRGKDLVRPGLPPPPDRNSLGAAPRRS